MINGTIWLNGRHEIIRDVEDLVQVIREHLGDDVAKMVQTLADLTDRAAHQANSDSRANELALEYAHSSLREIGETVELIRAEIVASRIKRSIVRELLDAIEFAVNENV